MPMRRRPLLAALGALSAPVIATPLLQARSVLPELPLAFFVGFAAGGGADSIARAIATQVQRRTGRHIAVEDRGGDSGAQPGEIIRKRPADGTRLALLASTTLVSSLVVAGFPLDPSLDLAPVTMIGTYPIAFAVSPKLGVNTFDEYLRWLKADRARRCRIGNTSNSAFVQVLNILLDRSIGLTLRPADYRGAVPLVNDLADGRIPAGVTTLTSFLPAHRGGRLKILMTTGMKRLHAAPDIPTAEELGYPGLDMKEWFAFFAATGTSDELINEWNHQFLLAINDPAVLDVVRPLGLEPATSTPQELAETIAAHQKNWKKRIAAVGMKPVN